MRSSRRSIADLVVPRAGQTEMVEKVFDALETDGHLLVQAGTGTGKSIGYLVPAMYWSVESGQRVKVSTRQRWRCNARLCCMMLPHG